MISSVESNQSLKIPNVDVEDNHRDTDDVHGNADDEDEKYFNEKCEKDSSDGKVMSKTPHSQLIFP